MERAVPYARVFRLTRSLVALLIALRMIRFTRVR